MIIRFMKYTAKYYDIKNARLHWLLFLHYVNQLGIAFPFVDIM
jgi:hypothetical protein